VLGTALLAYGFGLRHAVDNVTRKLMQDGKRLVTVGLFFSMGHSSVVILASAVVAVVAIAMNGHFAHYKAMGAVVSTSVSTAFLLTIAAMNVFILRSILNAWRRVRNGGAYVDDDFNALLAERGMLSRIFRRLFRFISSSWHMYPLGILFRLGFDTSTEIALLGISGDQAAQGLSPWAIMVFPLLFSAGMSLVDTLDGHLILGLRLGLHEANPQDLSQRHDHVDFCDCRGRGGWRRSTRAGRQSSKSTWRRLGCDRYVERKLRRTRVRDHRHFYCELGIVGLDLSSAVVRYDRSQAIEPLAGGDRPNQISHTRRLKRRLMGLPWPGIFQLNRRAVEDESRLCGYPLTKSTPWRLNMVHGHTGRVSLVPHASFLTTWTQL
jgi:HoxN/HupN/NixA family high-affinity nickel-transporter